MANRTMPTAVILPSEKPNTTAIRIEKHAAAIPVTRRTAWRAFVATSNNFKTRRR